MSRLRATARRLERVLALGARSCQDLWTFLPASCGSGHGIASVEFDTEEFTDGHDLAATATGQLSMNVLQTGSTAARLARAG